MVDQLERSSIEEHGMSHEEYLKIKYMNSCK